ncbi:MAG: extensin family protein, partial [Paracoccaceae bacterium]
MIRRAVILATFLTGLTAQALWAEAPDRSLRPQPRPEGDTAGADAEVTRMVTDLVRPRARPKTEAMSPAAPEQVVLATSTSAVLRSIRPEVRPENLKRRHVVQASGMRTQPAPIITQGSKGALCGIEGIQGVKLAPIAGRIQGCGVADPVRVVSVDGVQLSTPAIMDCPTAQALNAWVVRGVKPSIGRLGGGVAGLKVAAHYAC